MDLWCEDRRKSPGRQRLIPVDLGVMLGPSGHVSPGTLSLATAQAEEYPVFPWQWQLPHVPHMGSVREALRQCYGSQGTFVEMLGTVSEALQL